jgi:PatG C-terminal
LGLEDPIEEPVVVAAAPVAPPSPGAPQPQPPPGATPAVATPAPVLPPTAAAPEPTFVYALGQIEPRFPSLSVEKELAQAIGGPASAGLSDRQTIRSALTERQNRYLARNLCWVFVIEGIENYILVPRDPADIELLIDAYRDEPRRDDLDAVIGIRTQMAPPELCNGLALPIVVFDQLYAFDRDSLIEAIPRPDSVSAKNVDKFRATAGGLFDQILQMADNSGAIDEHRALNYLTVRYPRIYGVTAEQFDRNFAFTGVEVRRSIMSGIRSLVDVIFSYRHRETDVVEKQFVRVDVTEEFPFLVTKMSPYFDR